MKLPFVTRKKYEIEKENLRKINNQRSAAEKENKEYQEKILWLNNKLTELKIELEIDKNRNKLIKTLPIDKCKKCGDAFIKTQKNRKFCDNCKRKKSK